MIYGVPIQKATRTTWRVTVAEIAAALGVPAGEHDWFVIEDAEGDGIFAGGEVDLVRWSRHPPHTYQDELARPPARTA